MDPEQDNLLACYQKWLKISYVQVIGAKKVRASQMYLLDYMENISVLLLYLRIFRVS